MEIKTYLPVIGAAVAVTLWFLTRWFELYQKRQLLKNEQRNLVRALYAEIDFNTRDMEFFNKLSPDIPTLRQGLNQDANLIPHITEAKQTAIYRAKITEMHLISDDLIRGVVDFYGLLEKISSQVAGLNSSSYKSISPGGRLKVIQHIYDTSSACHEKGLKILRMLEDTYPDLSLRRAKRKIYPE